MFFRLGYHINKDWNIDGNFQSGSSEKPYGSCTGLTGLLSGFDTMLPGFWELFYTATITIKPQPKIHKLQSLLYKNKDRVTLDDILGVDSQPEGLDLFFNLYRKRSKPDNKYNILQ